MSTTTDALGNLIVTADRDERPTVVLFSAVGDEVRRWSGMLCGDWEIHMAADLSELDLALASHKVDVVVASECDDLLLERLNAHRNIRFIHCSAKVGEDTLFAAERGMNFVHIDDAGQLSEKVLDLAYPRSMSVRHQIPSLSVRWRDGLLCPVVDVSNEGFSFRVEPEYLIDTMLPGAILEGVEIFAKGRLAISESSAIVRHVAPLASSSGYVIGCQFRVAAPTESRAPISLIRDRALCAGLLRNALRAGTLILQHMDYADWEVRVASGEIDMPTGAVALQSDPGPLQPFDVVRGRFEQGGAVYRFTSSVVARQPFVIRAPVRFEVMHNRSSARFQPPPSSPIYVELKSLLLGETEMRSVRDVSSTGFSLEIDRLTDLYPPGLVFDRVTLKIGDNAITVQGRVRNVSLANGGRCGVEFEGLTDELRSRLAESIIGARYPGLVDGRRVSFERLWKFFLDTRFIYPEKEASLAPLKAQIQSTVEAVNSTPNRIFNSVVAVQDDNVVGYISGVRVYSNSILSQHLAADTGKQAGTLMTFGQLMSLGQVAYIAQKVDLEFWKMYFRPDNKWPARVFGGFARTISDPRLADYRTYSYLKIPTDTSFAVGEGMEVVEADEDDRMAIERYFVERERGALIRSDDLSRGVIDLAQVNAQYSKLGLTRTRRVLMVRRARKRLGFALAELSSPGLNLSELLSSFRIYILPSGKVDATAVRSTLLAKVVEIYRDFGRTTAIGLVPVAEQMHYDALGLTSQKRYTMLTWHRTLVGRFSDHLERLKRMLEQRVRKKLKAGT